MSATAVGSSGRLLLVDDDAGLCELVEEYLTSRGFVVESEGDGLRGLECAQSGNYILLVLDVMLPGIDGFEVLRRLRTNPETARLPVVMLTAHGDETDRIVGLELGADDYLSKPFNPRELLARIHAVLRRTGSEKTPGSPEVPVSAAVREGSGEHLQVCDLEMNVGARMARSNGTTVDLTAIEFDLLHVLMLAAGRVVPREELARDGLHRKLLPLDRSLDIHISKLRGKLWPDGDGLDRLKTVRGVGYILTTGQE